MTVMMLAVRPFPMGTAKEAALKPLEEAAEAFGAWQGLGGCGGPWPRCRGCGAAGGCDARTALADEIADCVTACCNLAYRHGIDLQEALDRVERRNRERGRYE